MDPLGLAVIVAVLLVATTFGLWRRRTDGIIRDEAEDRKRRAEILAAAGLDAVELPDHSAPASTATVAAKAASAAAAVALQGTPAGPAPVRPIAAVEPGTVVPDRDEQPGVVEDSAADPSAAGARLAPGLLDRLGIGPAEVTLLQFSSAFCAPCRAVRRVSAEVAELLPRVQHVEIDAESHLDEVRELGIWRTPTLLVLDRAGRVAKRATGVPSKPQLIAAIGELMPPAES
ncbi:thioredoxin family protein [Actinoplanes sp. KI2]|uniref:thioredoxin family protein n=1 Tax=Actinoplanes sp. KI2 TaxID=2983315 RepID=UPI0021D5A1FF|nr:thioredoxin family protein [Actinoplanes sp. KI2]MCU7725684.1 thioredoxin family protein [Actinoplanes sp. KI2]